ncbi:hypothetical protein L7F22_059556 [Adiantum nelumboides]|nr:hypothetical protein [Adiantum nelumboides]
MLPAPPTITEFEYSQTHHVMRNMPRKRHNSLDEEIAAPQRTATGSPGSPCWFTLEELALASDNFSRKQRLLVYHFVQNQTLEYHLHCQNQQILKWPTRLKIALGAAQGLAYLHEDCHPRIIHRDIKASNILLDNDFNAVVSDFGLAKLTSEARSHITTRVMGTFGYLAPEYALTGKLTEKSDVYSFGVLLLEIITGRKPVDSTRPAGEESLVDWARTLLTLISTEEDLHLLADPLLEGAYEPKEMFQMITAAAACVRHSSSKRPPMRKVSHSSPPSMIRPETEISAFYMVLLLKLLQFETNVTSSIAKRKVLEYKLDTEIVLSLDNLSQRTGNVH